MASLAESKLPEIILLPIVALAARFSSHPFFATTEPRTRGAVYMNRAAALLNPSDVDLNGIQACVLLGACRIVEGDAMGESVYYGMACRMAQLLDLTHRAFWHSLVMIDEWSSSGVGIPRQIAHPPIDVPLPMEEMTFLGLRHSDHSGAVEVQRPISLLGQMIVLNSIFKKVNQLNVKTARSHDIATNLRGVQDVMSQLEDWEASLPGYMQDTQSNLSHYAAQGLGRVFVAVYLGFYHYGQLLTYQFLHHNASNDPSTTFLSQRCKDFAEKLCNMVYTADDTPGCDVLYNMVGHILVIASTIQIHTLLFSSDNKSVMAARDRLERNYTILLRLRQLWPTLDYCMMRLKVFHRACVISMETSFKLDDWMLKFLSEFAKPVNERDQDCWAIGDINIVPFSDQEGESLTSLLDMLPDT
ncbi:hypothetical protein E4T43_08931 [Aureobasidium subglaciale]|nr:hypothetical protein E4T43_08931 [Aureobasidium subglaciale]